MLSRTPSDIQLVSLRSRLVALLLVAAVAGVSGVSPTAAAVLDKHTNSVTHQARAHYPVPPRRQSRASTFPRGPEYGFLKHIPPNAIRMPGYIFVPGVGILGESCDLPTSACSNRYRDIQ